MKKALLLSVFAIFLFACQNKETEREAKSDTATAVATETEKWNGFYKIDPTKIKDNAIKLIEKDWMLITSGDEESFNTMTASWGAMGALWYKPVFMVTVRESRYTHEFLQKNEYYTLSFFPEELRDKLSFLGSRSGRDTDKIKESGLTPIATPTGSMTFGEARIIVECKKIYADPFNSDAILDKDIVQKVYGEEESMHTLFIGEIINVWVKE